MTIYLYVKQHSVTGLKYFGKTTRSNAMTYLGSGKYWSRHIKKYGKQFVETINLWEFDDQEEASKFALKFSEDNNIVESQDWANLKPENAKDGGFLKNRKISIETRNKMSKSGKGRIFTEEHKRKISNSNKGKPRGAQSDEHKQRISEAKKKVDLITCPHCSKVGDPGNMNRWHFSNCKLNILQMK